VRLGADVNARDKRGRTPIFACALLRRLLAHGASPDAVDDERYTPLMTTCVFSYSHDVAQELARRSTRETRRAVVACPGRWNDGYSAVDFIARTKRRDQMPKELFAELLVAGASVLPEHAAVVLPVAVSHGLPLAAQREGELAALRPAELCSSWRAHEAFAGLALQVKELRAAESEVEGKRRRMLELEIDLLALGLGAGSGSGSDEEDESGDDEGETESESQSGSEEEEATAAPAGGSGA